MSKNTKKKHSHKPKNALGYIDPTVAGIDIGANLIHVAVPNDNHGATVLEFGSTTPELHKIVNVLKKAGVITAVMEATGVYWIPLYEILEESGLTAVLVDAKSCKTPPGRKTDVLDCQWIQTLFSSALLTPAFRPPRNRIKLRSYVRQRRSSIKTRQYSLHHMEKALQLLNIKLSDVLGEIGGISGMNIMRAIAAGEQNPIKLAALRNKRVKQSQEAFEDALTGNFQEEHVFSLGQALDLYDFANKQLEECDKKIVAELETLPDATNTSPPKRDKDKKKDGKYTAAAKPKKNDLSFDARALLWRKSGRDFTALPGIQASTALVIFSELGGADVSSWDSVKRFSSWLKTCPGNNVSGGKSRKSKHQPCANPITQALRMAALSAKKSTSIVGARIRSISGRADKRVGIKAGAHQLSRMIYHMCKEGWEYHEKGEKAYEKACEEKSLRKLLKKAKEFGFELVPSKK